MPPAPGLGRARTSSPGRARTSTPGRTRKGGEDDPGGKWGVGVSMPSQTEGQSGILRHCVDSPLCVWNDISDGHDKYSQFFYRPHFLIALSMGTAGLYWAAFYTSGDNFAHNVKRGLAGVCLAFWLYCSLPTPVPNAVFRRPHPIIWRLVTGASIMYLLFLIFILFQTVHDGRMLVAHIDPCRNGLVQCAGELLVSFHPDPI